MAKEYGVGEKTIRNDAEFADAVDTLEAQVRQDIRSWQEEADGKVYVVLRDPCLALGINPDGQVHRLQVDEFFQLECPRIVSTDLDM